MNQIDIFKDEKNTWHVEVNGVNLAAAIIGGGLSVSFEPGGLPPRVHMTLRADKLNMRLPEAVIEAIKQLDPVTEPRERGREIAGHLRAHMEREA